MFFFSDLREKTYSTHYIQRSGYSLSFLSIPVSNSVSIPKIETCGTVR